MWTLDQRKDQLFVERGSRLDLLGREFVQQFEDLSDGHRTYRPHPVSGAPLVNRLQLVLMCVLLINEASLRQPHLCEKTDGGNAHLWRVLHGRLREAARLLDELGQEVVVLALMCLHKVALIIHLNKWEHLIDTIEVVNHIRIQVVELIDVDRIHLLSAICEVANA